MKRAAIYARQSVTKGEADESTSLAVQEEECRRWCAANGYAVAGVFKDPDTSGSKVAAADRPGWRALAASDFDCVVVFKFDRLARDETDSAVTRGALAARGKRLVSATEGEDPMTAGILSVVAAHFSRQHSERTSLSRCHNIRDGRAVGGTTPYGWTTVPLDPEKPKRGMVIAQDPDRIGHVREMVRRVRAGDTVYGVSRWLTARGVEPPAGRSATFRSSTVERILRHPILAGMVPFNPGNVGSKTRGADVLRGPDGLPVVRHDLAIMSVAEWRALVAALDGRTSPQARPRDQRAKTSSLLSGLVLCGDPRHDAPVKMWRGTTQGRPSFSCPRCSQTISNFEDVVVREFLRQKGERLRWTRVSVVHVGGAAALPEIEHRLDELDRLIRDAPDREARADLQAQQAGLLDLRDERRAEAPEVEYVCEPVGTFAEAWEAAADVAQRRGVLDDGLARITVVRGGPGRRTEAQVLARLRFEWVGQVGPEPVPDETWVL